VRAAHQFVTFAVATPLQHGAVAALCADRRYFDDLRKSYRAKRDYLAGELSRLGFEVYPSAGTYFLCAGFSAFGFDDDVVFSRYLTEHIGVAAIPPSVFHDTRGEGRNYIRFAFCKKDETLREAVARLEKLCVSR
jgi:N-succinyldiaminopimelate aminotransferase